MKKAIFLDIDGTLIDCMGGIKDITPNVKKAIKSSRKRRLCFYIYRKTFCTFR